MSTARPLTRLGAVATLLGATLLVVSTLLHPLGSDPGDAPAAFAEYAADPHYVWSHLGQFAGSFGLGAGMVAFAATFEPGRAAAWARIGAAATVAGMALAAALQAVDGVALKAAVDRWVAADAGTRPLAYEAAYALRQIEIGLAGFLGVLFGLALIALGLAGVSSDRYPAWSAAVGLLDGSGMAAAGAAQASTGFSGLAMALSMLASSVFLAWAVLAGVLMRRWAIQSGGGGDAV